VPSLAWAVPGLLSKTTKREMASRTAMPVQAQVVPIYLVLALCSLIASMVWALSGTTMLDIFV